MTIDAIRAMRDDYLWSHSICAYCAIVPKSEYEHCTNGQLETEHIFQNFARKIDDPANYVVCCRLSHEWKHKWSILGRIAALTWKFRNGEFDRERLRELTGIDPLGWLRNRQESVKLPVWASALVDEIIKAHL